MSTYAQNTQVSADRSIEEIKSTLRRFEATAFSYFESDATGIAGLEFDMHNRRCRFIIKLPQRDDFTRTEKGRPRSVSQVHLEWEKAIRQKWRSLALIVKAKLVAVDEEVVEFEQEFAMHFVMDNGKTVFEGLRPALEKNCSLNTLPALMPPGA